ncbi:hypothetical protein M0R45_001046 [Rubus argutus]|uniref:Uncharacterized protein n=1 Tax=Rubus argutus TaxID=59490 RepID=A0AAW1VNA4_RUBAR
MVAGVRGAASPIHSRADCSSPVLYLPSDDGVRGQRNRATSQSGENVHAQTSCIQTYANPGLWQRRTYTSSRHAYSRVKYMDHYQCCYEYQCRSGLATSRFRKKYSRVLAMFASGT